MRSFLTNHRRGLISLYIVYCVVLASCILFSSLSYAPLYPSHQAVSTPNLNGWTVYEDGVKTAEDTQMPYSLRNNTCGRITLLGVLPDTDFRAPMLITNVYQKNLSIYVDEQLIYQSVVMPAEHATDTPGSGKFFVVLPPDSAGATIRMEYEHLILADHGPIAPIDLQDGVDAPYLMIPGGNYLFFIVSAIFLAGVVLLVLSWTLVGVGAKLAPLMFLALFCISTSMWILCNTKMLQFFTGNLILMHNLEYMSFFLIPLALWSFLWSNWRQFPRTSSWVLSITAGFFALALSLKAFGILDFYRLLPVFHMMIVLGMGVFIVVAVGAFRDKDFSLKVFFLGFAQLCLFALIDLVRYYTVFSPESMASFFIIGVLLMGVSLLFSFIFSTRDHLRVAIEHEMYKTMAFTDFLTGIPNRMRFEADLKALEAEKHEGIILVNLDANDFKAVNDTYGHPKGDEVLRAIAARMELLFCGVARCYRVGGDEFSLLSTEHSRGEIDALLHLLESQLASAVEGLPISVSYGVEAYDPALHSDLQALFRAADATMYVSKRRYHMDDLPG